MGNLITVNKILPNIFRNKLEKIKLSKEYDSINLNNNLCIKHIFYTLNAKFARIHNTHF